MLCSREMRGGKDTRKTTQNVKIFTWKAILHMKSSSSSPPEAIYPRKTFAFLLPSGKFYEPEGWKELRNLWGLHLGGKKKRGDIWSMKNCVTTSTLPLSMIYNRITFNLRFVAAVVQFYTLSNNDESLGVRLTFVLMSTATICSSALSFNPFS